LQSLKNRIEELKQEKIEIDNEYQKEQQKYRSDKAGVNNLKKETLKLKES